MSHFPKPCGRREWVGSVGCLKALTVGWQAHVVAKIQEFWAGTAAGALQQFHAPYLLLSQLFSLEFSYQKFLWASWTGISLDILAAQGYSAECSQVLWQLLPVPSGKGQWSWAIPLGLCSTFPVATTLYSVLSSLRGFFLSVWLINLEEISLNHRFHIPTTSPFPRAAEFLCGSAHPTCTSTAASLGWGMAAAGNGWFTPAEGQTKLSFISVPSAWAADPEPAWREEFPPYFMFPPQEYPEKLPDYSRGFFRTRQGWN